MAAKLGEAPAWVAREQSVYFVDIKGPAIHRWQAHGNTHSDAGGFCRNKGALGMLALVSVTGGVDDRGIEQGD